MVGARSGHAVDRCSINADACRLAEVTVSPHDRAQAVGDIAGEAFAHLPHGGGDLGYRLLAAGLLMVTGVIDYDRLGPAMRAAYDHASNPTGEPKISRP